MYEADWVDEIEAAQEVIVYRDDMLFVEVNFACLTQELLQIWLLVRHDKVYEYALVLWLSFGVDDLEQLARKYVVTHDGKLTHDLNFFGEMRQL